MSAFTDQLNSLWTWFKTRQKLTLAAGAAIGAIVDDPIIAIIQTIL